MSHWVFRGRNNKFENTCYVPEYSEGLATKYDGSVNAVNHIAEFLKMHQG